MGVAVLDACLSDPCQNGGSCSSEANVTYSCHCVAGFTGHSCKIGKYLLNIQPGAIESVAVTQTHLSISQNLNYCTNVTKDY